MLTTTSIRRAFPFLAALLLLLAALPAGAASLSPDKAAIAVGETTYVKLESGTAFAVQWSVSPELKLLSADSNGATVKALEVGTGTGTVNAKWLTGKKSASIKIIGGGEDDEAAVKLEGMARAMGMPDLDARIARMLFEVNTGKRSPKQFYEGLAAAGGKMTDVINVRKRLVDHPDQSFTRQIMGPTFSENGTPVEQKILTWRRAETLAAIDEVVKQFVDAGRIPANGFELIISHVGKWANQADRSLTFTGDIDFSFVSNDTTLTEAMKEAYGKIIERRTRLNQIAIDSVATAHGKAGLEVYIGRHGMAFAEEQMKINEVVDMTTGSRTKIEGDGAVMRVGAILTIERQLADAAGIETKQPVLDTEPGLSMEMARHFQHDIVQPRIFDLSNAVVKAAKYLDRSYKALDKAGGKPSDPGLAEFARQVTELANAKPQTKATRDNMIRLISDHLGSPPQTVWDMGTNKLVLTIDAAAVERFHQGATKALWETVRQGSNNRTNDLETRLTDLLDRQNKGDKVDEEVAKLRQEMVDLVDMVEAEIKAAHGADIPSDVINNNARVRGMLDTLSKRFGVKALSAEELKDKRFVEELLKAQAQHPDPSRLKMIAGYVMERSARAAELSMSGVEKTNQLLDIIDDRLLGPLRGDSDFAEFEAEMKQVQQAARDPRLRSDATSRLSVVKTKVASAIKGTNLYLNEKLQATAAGRQGMKFMMVYGLVDEMKAYRDAFNEQGWGGFATEIFKRRIPFGGAVESAVMGNTLRAGWDVVTTLIPPLALPEAAYGLGTMIGTQVRSTYWNEQLALFTDSLYADAIFKLEEVQTYEGAKVGVYRLVRTFHHEMPLDLHRFAEMRKDQVEALSKEVEAGHVNWQAYKNNFNGLTEWLDVDATLKNNLAASDPALQLLEEMANHEAVGPRLMERLAEKGLARWEQVKLGYVVKLIQHLEDRKQADDALGRGMLPDLFAELRKVAADLAIEDEVMQGLDAEVDTSNLKGLIKWLWDAKRYSLGQAPTESETTRAAQAVKKYLDAYKQVQALRDQAAGLLTKAGTDVNTRYLTSNLFLTGRAEPDLATARAWLTHIETARKAMAGAILAIKRTFLAKAGLDSNDQPYLDRAFAHEVWIKPYQDGNARLKKAWMLDYAAGHVKERDKVLAEYKAWLTKVGPVQLTVTAVDAKDAKKTVRGLKIALAPTDELGSPVSASAAGNQVVAGVAMGRYRLTASASGYQEASRNVVYGRGLSTTPSETFSLTPTGKEPDQDDKDKDQDAGQDGKPDTGTDTATDGKTGADKPAPAKQGAGGSASGQFPGEPFNGMQISYSFSGCSLPEMKDSHSFTTSRSYRGRLGSGSMTVSGSARMGMGYGATLTVSVSAGGEHKEYSTYIKTGWPGYNTATFNLTIPIPATATSGGFGIRMAGEYNAGGRGLVVTGSCSADGPDGPAPQGTGELSVDLSGPKDPVPMGKEVEVSAYAKGGRFPYAYSWTGASGENERAKVKIARPGSQPVAVTVSDSDGKRAGANLTIKVAPLKLELVGAPKQAYYGSSSRLQVKGLPDFTPAADPCAGRQYTGSNPFDECVRVKVDPSKAVSVPPQFDDGNPPPPIAASATPARASAEAKEGAYRFIWQSDPGLTFEPPTSSDGATWVTFDRMGRVKLWCEVHQMIEGAWQTVGETDQVTVDVVAPAFRIDFAPPDGQAKVGQDVRATVVAKPEVPAKLIDYRWFDPGSSNRMEYTDNAGEIGFQVKDAKPMKLEALARVPHYGDEIAKITSTYTGVAYEVKIGPPRARGPQLQVWVCDTQFGNAKNCGMKDIPQGQFATFQDITLAAEVTPTPPSPRYRWTVDPSGSCGLPGSGSELRLNCSSTGSYAVRLQVFDKDNLLLGQAEGAVSVTVSDNDVRQAPKSKEAWDKMQQAKQQADQGQLDEAINLANTAAGQDPKNGEAKDLSKRWTDERNTVRQQLDQARKALQANKPDDAQKAVDAAKKLHPKYPPVLDAEKQVADKRKGLGQTATGKPVETAAGAAQPLDLSAVGGKKAAPRTVKGVSIDDGSWIRLKSTDENRRSVAIPVPTPTRAAAVAIVSNLDDATYLEQGRTIARIVVSKDTGDEVLDIQAGVHSSEWNYGVGPKHKRVDGADIGDNRFLAILPLARPGLVKGLRIEYVETNAPKWSGHAPGFCLRGVSLVADTRGLTLTPAGSQTAATPPGLANVAGKWKTSEGELTLNQNGRSVSGNYSSDGGEIVGELTGNVLEGFWIENSAGERCATPKNGRHYWGRIRWAFSGDRYAGGWSYCDKPVPAGNNWTGERIGAGPATSGPTTTGPATPTDGGRDYTGYTPPPAVPDTGASGQPPANGKLVLEDDVGPYQWIDSTELQTRQVHAGRAAFRSNGNDHFTHRLGLAGNYSGQYRYIDFWLWFDQPGADLQVQVQVDGAWGKRWGYEAGPKYDGYGWAMEGTTAQQPAGRWLHLRLDLIEQLHIAAGQAITGLAFSADGADVYYDSVYLLPVEAPQPAPAVNPAGKRVLEDDAGPYQWVDATVVQKEVVASGRAAFRSDGNDHFTADLGVVGDYPEQFRSLSLWLFPIGAGADIQLQVQVDGQWGKRWGYEAGPKYDGYGWAMEGTTAGLRPGVWQEIRIDLMRDLHINPGQRITGLAFSSDGGDVYFDAVYLHANPSPAVKPAFQPVGKRVLEDDTGGYNWVDGTDIQDWLVFNGRRAFRSNGNDHFLADLGTAGNGAGQYRAVGFWAFFMGPAADIQLQVQVNGNWGKRWGYEAGPKYDGYGWAMEGTTANLPSGRWTWIQADLIGQLHLAPGDKITGLAFSSDNADVAYDSVYLLPSGAAPGITAGSPTGGSDYTAAPPATAPGGRDYTGAPVQPGQLIFEVGNIGGVNNGPGNDTRFTLASPHVITLIRDYHWNWGHGATPGTIAVRDSGGRVYGPWPTTGSPGQGGVPNAYWTASPNLTLPAGTYTVIDSDRATWSHNAESTNRGFVRVEGYPADGASQAAPLPATGNAQVDETIKQGGDLLDAIKSLKGLFGK